MLTTYQNSGPVETIETLNLVQYVVSLPSDNSDQKNHHNHYGIFLGDAVYLQLHWLLLGGTPLGRWYDIRCKFRMVNLAKKIQKQIRQAFVNEIPFSKAPIIRSAISAGVREEAGWITTKVTIATFQKVRHSGGRKKKHNLHIKPLFHIGPAKTLAHSESWRFIVGVPILNTRHDFPLFEPGFGYLEDHPSLKVVSSGVSRLTPILNRTKTNHGYLHQLPNHGTILQAGPKSSISSPNQLAVGFFSIPHLLRWLTSFNSCPSSWKSLDVLKISVSRADLTSAKNTRPDRCCGCFLVGWLFSAKKRDWEGKNPKFNKWIAKIACFGKEMHVPSHILISMPNLGGVSL